MLVGVFEDPAAETFAVGSIEPSSGVAFAPAPDPAYAVSFGAGPYLYSIFLIRSSVAAPFDDRAFLIDLAEQHVALVVSGGVDPVPETAPPRATQPEDIVAPEVPRGGIGAPIDPHLGSLLVDIAPFRRVASPIADIHLVNSELSSLGDVGHALSEGTTSLFQFYEAPDALIVGVLIAEYQYPLFAAAVLGNAEELDVSPDVSLGSPHDRVDMVALGGPGRGPIGAAFRQGRTVYVITTADDIPVGVDAAVEAVGAIAAAHYDAGPQGATSAFVFPSTATAALQTLFLVGALGAGVGMARSMSGRPVRRIRGGKGSRTMVVDMTDVAGVVRWRGRFLFAVQLLCVAALVIGLTVLNGAVAVGIVVAALLIAAIATQTVRRMDMPAGLRRAMPRPGLARIGSWRNRTRTACSRYDPGRARCTSRVVPANPRTSRTRRPSRCRARPSRLRDCRPRSRVAGCRCVGLPAGAAARARYCRAPPPGRSVRRDPVSPFIDDDILPIRSTFSARRPFLESFSLRGREPFEEAIAVGRSVGMAQ